LAAVGALGTLTGTRQGFTGQRMSDANIAVHLSEGGNVGTVRDPGQPELVAHRPEAWRFLRLARVLGAAKAIAQAELGSEGR